MEQLLEYIKEYEETKRKQKLPGRTTHDGNYIYIFGTDIQFAGPYYYRYIRGKQGRRRI